MFGAYLQQSFMMVILCSGIPLAAGALAGLIVSILQTATQIQEQSIVYLVKFSAVCAVLTLMAPWFSSVLLHYMTELLQSLARLGGL
jgi:flagellar biosynthesis protein FliQ